MLRTFKVQTLTGSAQPLFGDVLTGAVVQPVGETRFIVLPVADTTIWAVGDRITIDPGGTGKDIVLVDNIPNGTTLNCHSEGGRKLNAYGAGTIIALSLAVADVTVQAVAGGANPIWIGADSSVTSAGLGKVIYQVTDSRPPFHMSQSATHNTVRTTDAWMAALVGTQAIVSANEV